jgi:hypothetical protein
MLLDHDLATLGQIELVYVPFWISVKAVLVPKYIKEGRK